MEFIAVEITEMKLSVKNEPAETNTQCEGQIDIIPDWKLDGDVESRAALETTRNTPSEFLPSVQSQVRWRTVSGTQMNEGKDETIARSDLAGRFIRDILRTQNPCTDDEIDIKYEGSGFEYNSTSNAEGDHDIDLDSNSLYSNMNQKSGTPCLINSEQIELSEFYLRLLQGEQDCETCQKYIRKLSEHIRATHASGQPTRDPLLIDPIDAGKSSAVKIKCEVDDDIERMDSCEESDSNVESVVEKSSKGDRDYNASHDLNPQRKSGRKVEEESDSDPDYNIESGSENDPDYITPGEVRSTGSCRKQTLTTHKRNHTGKIPSKIRLKCTVCEKSFSQKCNLDRHMTIHTGVKPYKCHKCDKSFREKSVLDYHLRSHTGDKPFKCDCCLKGFTTKSYLKTHMTSHHRENPFKCTECGKCFSQKCNLNLHMKCHTGDNPFKCTECEKSFSRKDTFDYHLRSHTGDKPFKCDCCLKGFSTKSYLKIHLRSHSQKGHLESEKTRP